MQRVLSSWVVAVSLAAVSLSGCSYKQFVKEETLVKEEWAQVQHDLQERGDLISHVVDTVKGSVPHEQAVFEAVSDSRARLANARTPLETIAAGNQQSTALIRLRTVIDNHPELKANDSFNWSMDQLAGVDIRIAVDRMRYNARVQQYNTSRHAFPGDLTAFLFNFRDYPFFMVPPIPDEVEKAELDGQPRR